MPSIAAYHGYSCRILKDGSLLHGTAVNDATQEEVSGICFDADSWDDVEAEFQTAVDIFLLGNEDS